MEQELDETRDEQNWRLRLQEFFDLRYVLQSEIVIIRLLVYGVAGLILAGAITAVMGILFLRIK